MDPLVEEAAGGSDPAWYKIVEVLGPPVRGFARARGVTDPDEVTQDVFLDAARNISTFEGDWTAFRSWIFTIAYRRVADHHRSRSRRVAAVPQDRAPEPTDPTPTPDSVLIDRETVDDLLRGLEALNPVERDVVLLRVIGELSSEEVGAVIGKSAGNVRVIQNRAIKRLRRALRKDV